MPWMTSPWAPRGSDALRPLAAGEVGRIGDGARGRSTRAHDDAGADIGDLRRLKPGILDRLLHGDVIPRGAVAEETHRAAVDHTGRIERGRALHLRTEAKLGIFLGTRDAGFGLVKARKHFLGVVSDGRDNAHPRDDNPPHVRLALLLSIGCY